MDKRILEHILREQREDIDARFPAEYHDRAIERQAASFWGMLPLIHGVRGCGKTTLCHSLLRRAGARFAYISFDDSRIARLTPADMPDLLEVFLKIDNDIDAIFFDQMPVSAEWLDTIVSLQSSGFNIIGARAGNPEESFTAGRFHELKLQPLSFKEFCGFIGVDLASDGLRAVAARRAAFDEYIRIGGFPGLLNNPRRQSYIKRLSQLILDVDILRNLSLSNPDEFSRFTSRIIFDSPQAVSYSQMTKEYAFKSEHTIKKYIAYQKRSGILAGLHKIAFRTKHRTIGEKLYAADHSMLNFEARHFSVALIERRIATAVCHEVVRRHSDPSYRVHYFSDRSAECEFVVCRDFKMQYGIQVCFDATDEHALRRKATGLTALARKTGCQNLLILTDSQERSISVNGVAIRLVPAYKYLLGDV